MNDGQNGGLTPNPENFRSEIARHRLSREAICDPIGMNVNLLSMYVNRVRELTPWAAHNIGYGINYTTRMRIFNVNMSRGIIKPPKSKPKYRASVRLPVIVKPKRRRRQRKQKQEAV